MKKTYFMKSYNLNFKLFLCSISILLITLILKFLSIIFKSEVLLNYTSIFLNLANILTNFVNLGTLLFLIFSIWYVISIFIEIIKRLTSDSLNNFFKSIVQTQQAQKMLIDMEKQIKKEISSQNPTFFFSSYYRVGNNMWLKGTKR